MRAMVTGCAGFIGSHLTESLLTDGIEVLGVDCFNDNYDRSRKLKNLSSAQSWDDFVFVPIDLARGALLDLVDEVDVVFHLAAEPGIRASWADRFELYVRNNVLGTHHLLQTLCSRPDRRLVYASSSSVYGEAERLPTTERVLPRPYSPYGVTKLDAENLCGAYAANYGLKVVSLRYFSVYGPRQRPDMALHRFCRAALLGEPIVVYGDGRQTRDFTYVSDIVRATRSAATKPVETGAVLNIGGGARISLVTALEALEEISGLQVEIRHEEIKAGDVKDTGADSSLAERSIDYQPSTDFREGLAAEYDWLAATYAAAA